MSQAGNRIVSLLTQATEALEKGQLQVRLPEPSLTTGLTAGGSAAAISSTLSKPVRLGIGTSTIDETEMSQVCRAFNRMADAICKRDRERLHFTAMAAHDLNNPLMVISGAARELRYNDMPLEDRQQCLERLLRNVASLQYLVADLNDKVQSQNGQLRLNFTEVDLTAVAREVVDDFAASITSHPIHFQGDGSCPILGDCQRLQRLLFNLLSNAVKYSDAGREITVSVWRRGSKAFLSVEDRGIGIAPSDTERMFLPFKRLDQGCEMADGAGMGLASVQKITEAHGAEIHVQGAPDQGTVIEVCFKLIDVSP